MTERDLPELEYQKWARLVAVQMLDQVQPGAALDVDAAFATHPGLLGEAAAGRTAATVRAMQLETEIRTNPELRADRFVQA